MASKYPTLGIQYQKAIQGVFGSDVDFDLLSVDLSKSDIPMGFYGKTTFSVAAGKFLRNQALFYPDFHHFLGNQNTVFESRINRFLFLDFYRFSTSDKYFEAHLEHNFSGFILNKVPLIRKLKLQELAGVNYLSTPDLRSYTEWFVGLQFLNLKAYYGWSYTDGSPMQSGLRFAVGLR
jgi:hypothetical protein